MRFDANAASHRDSTLNFTVRRAHEAVNRDAVLRTWGEGGC